MLIKRCPASPGRPAFCARRALGAISVALLVPAAGGACRTRPPDETDYISRIVAIRAEKDAALQRSNDPIPEDRKAHFLPLSYYPVDPAYSVPAQIKSVTAEPGDRRGEAGQGSGRSDVVLLPTSTGTVEEARHVGQLEFMLDGRSMKLTVFASGDGLFVPFRDLTGETETYKAGRYLNLERSATGVYELDFNKAYNPYCYYNPMYTCPFPPPENRLDVPVRAGETIKQEAEP